MQEIEKEEQQPFAPADPTSQPLQPVPLVQGDEKDDDPDEIFLNAAAEIDTQPLVKVKRARAQTSLTLGDVLEIAFIVSVLLFSLLGSVYLTITYPHTLVILYAKTIPAQITTTLDVPTRTLAPVTLTRSQTAQTTGTGYQSARAATGQLTFYNGLLSSQTVPIGTVFTGGDGVQVSTDQSVTIPAANPPQEGEATVNATTIRTGSISNIHRDDINTAFSSSLFVNNPQAFTGGRDARTYKAVAQTDLATLTSTVNSAVTQAFTTAFSLQLGEQDVPTNCTTKATANHQVGDEATSITVTTVKTCAAIVYDRQQVEHLATAAFTQTRPGVNYHLVGSIAASLQSVSPFTVTIRGKWMYTFLPDYEQSLAERIAGATPARARAYLIKTGIIAYASVPSTLPLEAMYIDFLVLVG